jgi:MoxR-like ATPase
MSAVRIASSTALSTPHSDVQQQHDPREAGRVVATVLLAAGPVAPTLVEQAHVAHARLTHPRLTERDFVPSTPEELAPLIPPRLRDALGDLILDLAGSEPLRQRVAQAFLHLWNLEGGRAVRVEDARSGTSRVTEKVARAMIGQLPRHQNGGPIPEEREKPVYQEAYRSREEHVRPAPPVVDPLRARIARVQAEMLEVIRAVDRVVIGKHDVVSRVLVAMTARGHVLLMDSPGVGKTLLCKTMSAALGTRFGRIQLTPDLMPMDVTGGTIYDPQAGRFVFRPGPVFTNILLADEINRATPKTQSALLEVMEERTVTVDGTSHRMADPFQVLATMNPLDHDGTFPLPAAQIDRFMAMLEVGYPTQEDEVRVLDTHLAGSHGESPIAPVISAEAFVEWQRTVPLVHVSPEMKRAAVAYADGLRRQAPNGHTISPRAVLAWVRASQARAILAGREFVIVDDLYDVAPDILRHRLWVSAPEVRERLRAVAVQSMSA